VDFPRDDFRIGGEPASIRHSAQGYLDFAGTARASAGSIRTLDTSLFIGPEGDLYREGLNASLSQDLDIAGDAFGQVGQALASLAQELARSQDLIALPAVRGPTCGRPCWMSEP
jgi:hypothetical protein